MLNQIELFRLWYIFSSKNFLMATRMSLSLTLSDLFHKKVVRRSDSQDVDFLDHCSHSSDVTQRGCRVWKISDVQQHN